MIVVFFIWICKNVFISEDVQNKIVRKDASAPTKIEKEAKHASIFVRSIKIFLIPNQ